MREILFRGKRIDNGEWVQGCLVKFGKESFADDDRYGIMDKTVLVAKLHKDLNRYATLRFGDCDYIYHNIRIAEIIPKTVGQFTGLTDKNGKKIFEGDIVKDITDGVPREVFYSNESAMFLKEGILRSSLGNPFHLEVVGNIHDNPEILRGEEDGK